MNEKKIAFIICKNNYLYFNECCYYIRNLILPDGFELDIIAIEDAPSMCAGYNKAMKSSDAKYKVYLHQDVFIQESHFIEYILQRFKYNADIGMIGVMGGVGMPKTGVTYLAWNVGKVDCCDPDIAYRLYCTEGQKEDMIVDAVDGILIATQYDVRWREDLFVNFDFYDVSQSFEMRRAGYYVLVPYQQTPWVMHDSSFAKLNNYDKNRKIALAEYPEFFTEENGFPFVYEEKLENLSQMLASEVCRMIDKGNWEETVQIIDEYHKNKIKNSNLEQYSVMCEIYQKEQLCGVKYCFFDETAGYTVACEKYMTVRFLLHRIESRKDSSSYSELKIAVTEGYISAEAMLIMILHGSYDRAMVLEKIIPWYKMAGDKFGVQRLRDVYDRIKDNPILLAYSKRYSAEH